MVTVVPMATMVPTMATVVPMATMVIPTMVTLAPIAIGTTVVNANKGKGEISNGRYTVFIRHIYGWYMDDICPMYGL